MGNSAAIGAQYVFQQLHRGRHSEHVHPCMQACHVPIHTSLNIWTHTHTVHSLTWALNLCSVSWI